MPSVRRIVAGLILLLTLLFCGPARAYDFDVYAETVGQGYQLRAADDTLVNRRRITQQLGLDVYNLGPSDVMGRPLDRNQIYLAVSMRFDGELGDYATLDSLSAHTGQRELDGARLDLLYAYVGGHNLGGFVDFKLGRQIFVDLFDWRALDGLSVAFKTPVHLVLEAWGGLNVSGASPVDSPIYRVDGTALGGNPAGSLGARQEDALQPTFGLAARLFGLRDVSARLSYVRTMSFTENQQPGEPSTGVVEESLALVARGRLWNGRLNLWAGARYNLLAGLVDEIQAGARLQLGRHGLQAEYVYAAPTFDGDSIWNVFGAQAFNDVRLAYDLTFGRVRAYLRAFGRFFDNDTLSNDGADPLVSHLSLPFAAGGSVGARLDGRRGYLRLDGYYEDGWGGLKGGVDLAGRLLVFGDWQVGLSLEGRISYVHFRDDARTIDHADSVALQLGGRYAFSRGLSLHLAVEENVNRFFDSQFRLLAILDVSFWIGPHGMGFTRSKPGLF